MASRSPPPRPPATGATTASTSSTRPGHVDFTAEVERSLRVLDGAVAVFCAVGGVEPQSETVWRQADKYGVPRIAFVNKMDRVGADFDRRLRDDARAPAARTPVPIQIPVGRRRTSSAASIDLVEMQALVWDDETLGRRLSRSSRFPTSCTEAAERAREQLVEAVCEVDDALLEKYLAGEAIDAGRDARGAPRRARSTLQLHAGALRQRPSATRASSRCSTPSSTTCRRRSTSRRSRASIADDGETVDARGRRRRAVRGAGLQDHDRPVRRAPGLRPGLLRRR